MPCEPAAELIGLRAETSLVNRVIYAVRATRCMLYVPLFHKPRMRETFLQKSRPFFLSDTHKQLAAAQHNKLPMLASLLLLAALVVRGGKMLLIHFQSCTGTWTILLLLAEILVYWCQLSRKSALFWTLRVSHSVLKFYAFRSQRNGRTSGLPFDYAVKKKKIICTRGSGFRSDCMLKEKIVIRQQRLRGCREIKTKSP